MIRFGLTGGIATGKSLAADFFRARGVPVVDADQVARDVVAPGTPGLARIVEVFGPGFLAADGTLDRPALGLLISSDPEARANLEALTHPLIYDGIAAFFAARAAEGVRLAGAEATLLVETGRAKDPTCFDALVVVTCSPATQVARLLRDRGFTEARARAWLASQWPLAEKERLADVLIRNEGTTAELEAQVEAAIRRLVGG